MALLPGGDTALIGGRFEFDAPTEKRELFLEPPDAVSLALTLPIDEAVSAFMTAAKSYTTNEPLFTMMLRTVPSSLTLSSIVSLNGSVYLKWNTLRSLC